jgi:hypothetical protein
MSITQTSTPYRLSSLPQKDALNEEFIGKVLNEIRTPALVIDRAVFASNCARMHEKARQWGAGFRAHLKTHKVSLLLIPHVYNLYRLRPKRPRKVPVCSSLRMQTRLVQLSYLLSWRHGKWCTRV